MVTELPSGLLVVESAVEPEPPVTIDAPVPDARDVCPACGSDKVWVGNYVLSCEACGWHYLNRHPCRVCGKPSRNCGGVNKDVLYGCKEHPITEAEWTAVIARNPPLPAVQR